MAEDMAGLLALPDVTDVDFEACMHGAERDQWTRIRCNFKELGLSASPAWIPRV